MQLVERRARLNHLSSLNMLNRHNWIPNYIGGDAFDLVARRWAENIATRRWTKTVHVRARFRVSLRSYSRNFHRPRSANDSLVAAILLHFFCLRMKRGCIRGQRKKKRGEQIQKARLKRTDPSTRHAMPRSRAESWERARARARFARVHCALRYKVV